MTVADNYEPVEYTGNGVTTSFPFAFTIASAGELAVYRRTIATGVDQKLVLTTDYTVVGTFPGAGSITYNPASGPLPATHKLIIARASTFDQLMDITSQGGFHPTVLENQLDAMERQIQELKEIANRSLRFAFKSPASIAVPEPVAGNVLAWNSTATALVNTVLVAANEILPAVASSFLQRNAGNTAYESKTASQVWTSVSATSAFAQTETGSGWANQATPARIHRMNDRLFVGKGATDYNGNTVGGGAAGGWLMSEHGSYLMINATIAGLAEASASTLPYGVLGAAKSNTGYAAGVIGLMGYASVAGLRGWAGYLEVVKAAGTGLATGTSFGLEIDATNFDNSVYGNPHPYQASFGGGQVGALLLAAGGGQAGALNAQFALGITPNVGKFQRGIVVLETCLVPDGSSLLHALVLPRKGTLDWHQNGDNGLGFQLYSDISDAAHLQLMVISDVGLRLFNTGSKVFFQAQWVSGSVNGTLLTPSTAGNPVIYGVQGDDANIDLSLTPKGTGVLRFGTFTGTGDVVSNGNVVIKTSDGITRKLMTTA